MMGQAERRAGLGVASPFQNIGRRQGSTKAWKASVKEKMKKRLVYKREGRRSKLDWFGRGRRALSSSQYFEYTRNLATSLAPRPRPPLLFRRCWGVISSLPSPSENSIQSIIHSSGLWRGEPYHSLRLAHCGKANGSFDEQVCFD